MRPSLSSGSALLFHEPEAVRPRHGRAKRGREARRTAASSAVAKVGMVGGPAEALGACSRGYWGIWKRRILLPGLHAKCSGGEPGFHTSHHPLVLACETTPNALPVRSCRFAQARVLLLYVGVVNTECSRCHDMGRF